MAASESGGPGGGRPRHEHRVLALTHHLRLGERFAIQAIVRAVLAGAIVAGALVGRTLAGIAELDVAALVVLGLVMVGYDAVAYVHLRPYMRLEPDGGGEVERPAGSQRLLTAMYALIVLDYFVLVAAIWFVGGTRSPFLPFFLLHAILSCVLLSRRAALAFHWLAYGLLVAFVIGEWSGSIPAPHLPQGAVGGTAPLDGRYAVTVLLVYGVLFAVTVFLLLGFAETLRANERRIRAANAELTRLSLMRRDFLRIALHNLQSPIGVVTMFLTNLKAGIAGQVSEQQAHWLQRSLERLEGVKAFMHDLQMLSTLESGQLDTRAEDVDVRHLLADLVADHQDMAGQHHHELRLDVPPALPPVRGVELLLREAIVNFITNALKYTPPGGHVVVRARSQADTVRVEVEDDGIGITPADQARLFGEFVRIKAKDRESAAARAKGSGLGLTIVKRVAEVHGGRAGVESAEGCGSTFFVDLPSGGGVAAAVEAGPAGPMASADVRTPPASFPSSAASSGGP